MKQTAQDYSKSYESSYDTEQHSTQYSAVKYSFDILYSTVSPKKFVASEQKRMHA